VTKRAQLTGRQVVGIRRGRKWWLWAAIALIGLVVAVGAGAILVPEPLDVQSGRADVASTLGLLLGIATFVVAVLQLRQGSGSGRPVGPDVRREQQAIDGLRAYLGRQDNLRLMGDPATPGLGLRVHPAIDLPPPSTATGKEAVAPPAAGWAGLLPTHWLERRTHRRSSLDRDLPTFVDRDQGSQIHRWMHAARETGGFLLLVGNSSVGKTRLLYETARKVLPDFAVLAPDLGDGNLVNQLAAATFPLPRLLVWLDELQRFLDGPYRTPGSTPITAATVRRLLDAPTPVIIVGSLWPEHAAQLRTSDTEPPTDKPRPRYPNAVDILDDRRLHEVVLRTFSTGERQAAVRLAAHDPRLATALADRNFNVTEILAGARELVRRYERATNDQQAVIHAAIDARRLGIHAPLTDRLLSEAARGYLTTIHRDDSWFGPTLAELTSAHRSHDRATAPLLAVPNADRSGVLGYTVADYLLQRLSRQRRSARVPAATWQALISHTSDYGDLRRLADSAGNRLLYGYAMTLYRELADVDDPEASTRLVQLLAIQGRVDELRTRADAGDEEASEQLVQLLAAQGLVDELRTRADADAGDWTAMSLVDWLADQGRVDEAIHQLRLRADAGGPAFAKRLAQLLADQGRVDELRARADARDGAAAERLAQLLVDQGRVDELRARADTGDGAAAIQVADLVAAQGRVDETIELLRVAVDASDRIPAWPRDHTAAWAKDRTAAERLADLLADQGRIDELRARADTGDGCATKRLVDLLADQGRVDEAIELLSVRVDGSNRSGDWVANWDAAERLAELLADQGRVEEAIQLLRPRADAEYVTEQPAGPLASQSRLVDLPAALIAGLAADRLARLLADQGRVDELRARADAGDGAAAERLAQLLVDQGRVDELRARADAGDQSATIQLAELVAAQGRDDEAVELLRMGADAGGQAAALRLVDLLADQGRVDELRARADAGDLAAAERLVQLLADQDRVDELRLEVDAGTQTAGRGLLRLLIKQGKTEEAKRLRRQGLDTDGSVADTGTL
jgi:tetratricopeptide (TPR) repeat protein